jgi:hypothetical protein
MIRGNGRTDRPATRRRSAMTGTDETTTGTTTDDGRDQAALDEAAAVLETAGFRITDGDRDGAWLVGPGGGVVRIALP